MTVHLVSLIHEQGEVQGLCGAAQFEDAMHELLEVNGTFRSKEGPDYVTHWWN